MENNITICGVGKLGLGLALLIENAGYNVMGIDINDEYIQQLNSKTFKTKEPEYEKLLKNSTNFKVSTDLKRGLNHSNIIFILVETPNSGGEKFYDHSIVSNLLQKINENKVENKHIIIGCTVMPKYIDEVGTFLISDCKNTSLSYNPEFIAQGDIIKISYNIAREGFLGWGEYKYQRCRLTKHYIPEPTEIIADHEEFDIKYIQN